MQVKALKSFDSKPLRQHIRAGMTFNCEPRYAQELKKNKLVEILSAENDAGPGEPGPSSNKRIPVAPSTGKDLGKGQTPPAAPGGQGQDPTGGPEQKSASLPAGQVSRAKTVTSSSVGGRRGVVTPRRKQAVVTTKKPGTAATTTPAK